MNDHEIHLAKLEEAHRLGYSGDRAVNFASRLNGSTVEEVRADADALEEVFAGWRASAVPPPDRPTDHSQGMGPSKAPATPESDFADMMSDYFKGVR